MDSSEEAGVRAAEEGEATASEDELLELLRRERSDFLNYKRRAERERAEARDTATGEVVEKLLPVLDDLDRDLAHVPTDLARHPWAKGVALGRQRLLRALDDLGVERFGRSGDEFDPNSQEAIYYQDRPDAKTAQVAEVARPGYRVHGRLVRPAQVVVAGPPRQEESEQPEPRPRPDRRAALG